MNETLYRWVFVLFVAVVVPTTSGEEDGAGSGSPGALRVGSDKSKQQKALVVPSHLESVVDVWSAPFELEFIPKHEVTIELTGGGGDISFAPKELVFDGTEPFRKTFRIKGRKTGYFHIHYEFKNSKHPFPFAGMKQSLVYILDKAQVSVVQPSSGTLTVGLTSEPHKISLTRPSNLKVVPKAKGIVFEPREILFSRQGPQVLGFRAKVSENAGQGDDADKHKFSVLVSLELQCPGKEDDLDTCDRDGFYEPADFRWEINNVNKLEVKEKIVVTNKEVFDLPISFRFPQECRIEVFSNGLVLSKSVLQLSREDSSVTHYIKVMGRRDENVQRSCPSTDPCTYIVKYVVKDIHGRLITNFGTPPTYVTTVSIIDRAKIDLPGNETVAFLNQTLTLSLSWPEALQKEKLIQLQDDEQQRGKNGALFEVHIEGDDSDAVTIEPNVIQFKSQEDRLKQYPFNVTLHKEGLHTISFRLTGPRANLVQLLENSISITAYESFYEDNFSFSEKYGIGGLDSQLNEIMRRALISRVVSNEAIDALGVSHVKGILLHGPPGCGKTMVARQIGSMLQTHPPKVVNGPEIISKYLGESENKIRSLFADAEADHQGNNNNRKMHLIVFDEIDALVRPRGRGQGEAADQVYDGITNQLLSKMDGIEKLDNVLVVGTTNRKDLIDPALLRPGRFDVILEVNLPDREGRLQIFRIHTKKLYQNDLMGEDVDLEKLAKLTNTFTGAEIEAVVKAASSLAMEDMLKVTNSANIRSNQFSVKMDHFLKAMKDIEPANVDSHEMLDKLDDYGRLLVYNEQVESAINRFKNAVNYVVDHQEEGKRVMSILVHGDAGTGKTGFVANIMKDFNFSRLKIISAESLIMESRSSIERKILIIQDAFKSVSSSKHLCSALILDDLDGILEHVDTQAGQYVNSPMLSQLRILMRKPSQGSFVLVATASTSSIMKFNQLVDTFDLVIELPKVKSVGETRRILQDIEVNAEVKEHVIMPLVEEHLPIPIKKLLKFIDLAQSNADLIPEPPLARVIGDTADEPPPMMIDMVANNKTSMKIFLM